MLKENSREEGNFRDFNVKRRFDGKGIVQAIEGGLPIGYFNASSIINQLIEASLYSKARLL